MDRKTPSCWNHFGAIFVFKSTDQQTNLREATTNQDFDVEEEVDVAFTSPPYFNTASWHWARLPVYFEKYLKSMSV